MLGAFLQNKIALDPSHPGREHYEINYTRQPLPDPGAPAYSFDILALAPFTLIGTGVPIRTPFREAAPSMFVTKQVALVGQPTLTGQFVTSRLYNPNEGNLPFADNSLDGAFA